ncbi:MAG: hypothetical protein HQK50_00355 [Oligoflexia bacterium]|nr:hypothetical protein [Oligoflexia bacterium]MBF0363986.1 hypothetical protein [Oligoflexia bacterium]
MNFCQNSYFISCPRGLEEVLQKEVAALSPFIEKSSIEYGGIEIQTANPEPALKAILHSRVASRVYQKIAAATIRDNQDLYRRILEVDWPDFIPLDGTFKVQTITHFGASFQHEDFKNTLFVSRKAKDAIVDRFRKDYGKRPNVDPHIPDVTILLYLSRVRERIHLSILVDLCGEPLGNRHYRKEDFSAPLRENIAAGILYLSEWDPKNEIFIDSMCGSGTLLIEAHLMKANIPPSYIKLKHKLNHPREKMWSLEKFTTFPESEIAPLWKKLVSNAARERSERAPLTTIFGYDKDAAAITVAKKNAGQFRAIHIEKRNALSLTPPTKDATGGVIFCNPPYGVRLESENLEGVKNLYHAYTEHLKQNFKGYRAFILTSSALDLKKVVKLKTKARYPLFNGDLECRLLRYDLY